ncbi:MAG: LPS assembly lipoprotein LptE [Limisphaerales bacterium]
MNLRFSFLLCALALVTGCQSYRLGPSTDFAAGSRSVQVKFFKNSTIEPRLVTAVSHAFRKELQQDGTYALNTSGDADVVITGEIITYERSGIGFIPNDVITAQDYNISMVAKVVATEVNSGKVLMNRNISGRTTLRIGPDLASAERQVLPLLATDLARNATSILVDGNW